MKKIKINIDRAWDLIQNLQVPYYKVYYNEECLEDFKPNFYQIIIFVKRYQVSKMLKSGRLAMSEQCGTETIEGKTLKELGKKLEKFTMEATQAPLGVNLHNWNPDEWLDLKKAVKMYNLSVPLTN